MICTPDLLKDITDFIVGIFDPLLSDKHNPINISIGGERNSQENTPTSTEPSSSTEAIRKCKWDDSKRVEFQASFDESKIDEIYQTLSSAITDDVSQESMDNVTKSLNEVFMEPAKTTGMYKEQKPSKSRKKRAPNKPWFNQQCILSKNNYKNFKKSLHQPPITAENDTLKKHGKSTQKTITQRKEEI